MPRSRQPRRRGHAAFLVVIGLSAIALTSCFNPFRPELSSEPVQHGSGQAPRPTSSRNVMKLFKWCWEHQNINSYDQIFTGDFRFGFAQADSQGYTFPGNELSRFQEVDIARHLFIGGGATGEPPANSITLEFRSPLIAEPDTRPGKAEPWHVSFQTKVDITIRTDNALYRILSNAVFYAVRGDSADTTVDAGGPVLTHERSRWYIERYEELDQVGLVAGPPGLESLHATMLPRPARATSPVTRTASAAGASATTPSLDVTWGWIKSHWFHGP